MREESESIFARETIIVRGLVARLCLVLCPVEVRDKSTLPQMLLYLKPTPFDIAGISPKFVR